MGQGYLGEQFRAGGSRPRALKTQARLLHLECFMIEAKQGYVFVQTPMAIEFELLPGVDWISAPELDGWWVPEAEYLRLIGRPN